MAKRIEIKRHRTTPYPHQKTFMPNGTLREQQASIRLALRLCSGLTVSEVKGLRHCLTVKSIYNAEGL